MSSTTQALPPIEQALDAANARIAELERERDAFQQAGTAARRSEEHLQFVLAAARAGTWDLDLPTKTVRMSANCKSIYGIAPDASYDRDTFISAILDEDRDHYQAAIRAAVHGSGDLEVSYRFIRPDGDIRWVEVRGRSIADATGTKVSLSGIAIDATERKRAESVADARIRELEERYRLASRATSDAIWEWNIATDTLTWNASLKEFFGYDILSGDADAWFSCIHPDDRDRVSSGINAAILGQDARWSADYRFQRADGSYAEVFDRGFITRDDTGQALRMIGAMQDLTDRRQAEAELRRFAETLEDRVNERTEELAASNRQLVSQIEERERVAGTLRQMQRLEAVGQLTSGVAHDFNNLLTVIIGNLGFVQRGVLGTPNEEKLLRRLGFMESAAERGAKLTAQLLAFSRRQRLEPKPIDLNGSVANLRDLLQSTMGGSVRIETVLSGQLWAALCDPTQIELVILNLAINARDAMEVGGSLTVETSNVTLREPPRRPEEPEPGDYVAVAVCDTGYGMSEEVQAKAFEPFFTTKEIGKGTGLGLSQVLGFAKQSGGGVRIESRPGEGTTVKVFLPRAGRDTLADRARPEAGRDANYFTGATILLVDDDTAVREITAEILREVGYSVIEAGSGGAGLEALDQAEMVDLLLVDFAMPGMNGAEVAREAQSRRPGLPILFVTGYADLDAIRSVGEDRIVAKPFQSERLFQAVDAAIGASRRPGANVVRLRG